VEKRQQQIFQLQIPKKDSRAKSSFNRKTFIMAQQILSTVGPVAQLG
jgi:hypothetical protein